MLVCDNRGRACPETPVEGSVPTACRSAAVLSKSSSLHRKVLLNYRELSLFLRTAGGSHFSPNSLLSPPYVRLDCNFFVSPTYAKTGGATHPKMSARRHFHALLAPKHSSGSLSFQPLAHSFIFRITPISHCSNIFPTLHQKTRVYPPPVQPIAPEGAGPATRRSPTSEGLRYKGSLSPVTNHALVPYQFVGCATTPPCGTLVSPQRRNAIPRRRG
jgi:hypothetical protein